MNTDTTSLTKILNGINNTLNIANKVMPLYKEAKPILNTVTNTYKNIKNNKNELSNILKIIKATNTIKQETVPTTSNSLINNKPKLISTKTYQNINNPTFFI